MSQSLARALDVLDLVSRGTATLDALADQVGVHKSTVLRLLQTLEQRGFVGRDSGHRYHLGPAVFALAESALDTRDVRTAASPALRSLAAETGQTVHLATYQDGVVTYIDKVESRQPLRMYSRVGLPAALHATAVGKVLLGALDDAELDRVVSTVVFEHYTDRTISGAADLVAEVRRSADRGWAEDHEEHETFMNCVGAPVFGADGRVAAAVSVSVPNVVLPYEGVLALLPALLAATARISAELGAPARSIPLAVLPEAAHASSSTASPFPTDAGAPVSAAPKGTA
ncbi:IclR family transcriptional regulator [Leifsonia sp. LS1]|uniref:IclR family transcriptional regulator n=1 Tax=Leifsonia sp. LS1 TaxID=2828483 RepID=UPI001CFCE2C6|nr:IclR family transcriptional regulator [Leifsonia sp. LS1]GIT78333.1 IclR family transcriptional regulator [Leifsonia sp. LS1]